METGISLINRERDEQILKHGWTLEHDQEHDSGEILEAAVYAIHPTIENSKRFNWYEFQNKIDRKSKVERLIVAGALIAAEIDRLNYQKQRDV